MNHASLQRWAAKLSLVSLTCAGLIPASALAQQQPDASSPTKHRLAQNTPLSADQIRSLRLVSHNVLTAKRSGTDTDLSDDQRQVSALRDRLDKLIAQEAATAQEGQISVQGRETPEQKRGIERLGKLREANQVDTQALISQMRERAQSHRSGSRKRPADTRADVPEQSPLGRSAGMPIAEQRAQLFEKWSQKLENVMSGNTNDRLAQLQALRDQLRPIKGQLAETPLSPNTPTLQAMPAGYVAPKGQTANAVK